MTQEHVPSMMMPEIKKDETTFNAKPLTKTKKMYAVCNSPEEKVTVETRDYQQVAEGLSTYTVGEEPGMSWKTNSRKAPGSLLCDSTGIH